MGPNGSGKTTLLRILAGLLRPSRGVVRVCGAEPWSRAAKACRGVVLHHAVLYDELTVEENLRLYAALAGLRGYDPRRDDVVARLGLLDKLGVPAGWLSFGWRRRADIARALVHRPRVILIDEPFTGLDEEAVRALADVIELMRERGAAVLMTAPRAEGALASLATRVYELAGGRLVERG